MDTEIEEHIKSCHPCQITSRPERPEPFWPNELPKEPWTHLAIDVCGPFPTGEYVVVLTDYYSRWSEVKILKSVTSAKHPNLARYSVYHTWLSIPNQDRQRLLFYITRVPFYPEIMGCGIENSSKILATGKWTG